MWELIKKGLCLSCIVFSNDPASRGAVQSALKSLTYGIPIANFSHIPNITAIEIPRIANFSNAYNLTLNCTSTLTLDPVSFLAELESATAARELEIAFPITAVPLTATSVFGGNPAVESLRGILPNFAANNVIVVYPTPTKSTKTSGSDAVSSSSAAMEFSTAMVGTSSTATEAFNHARSSSTVAHNPSSTLDLSTTSSLEPTGTHPESTKVSSKPATYVLNQKETAYTSPVRSSDHAKTASPFKQMSTSAESTMTNQDSLAGMSSEKLEITHSSSDVLLESPIYVLDYLTTKRFSKSTTPSTTLGSHTVSGEQASKDTFSSLSPSPRVSVLNATTTSNYISPNPSATVTSISSSTASFGFSISAADYSMTGAYKFPKLNVSDGLAAASVIFSGTTRPNSSFSEQGMSTTGAQAKPTIDLSNIYSTASNISGTAKFNSSAVDHSITLPIIDSKYNSLIWANDSSGIPSPNSWIPAAMFFELKRKKESKIANNPTENHLHGFPNSNASQPTRQNQTKDAITLIDFTNQVCEGNTTLNKRGLCNLTVNNLNQGNFTSGNFTESMFTFEELKNITAQFDYVGYWDKINDIEKFQDEPEISDLEYFEMTQENVKRSMTYEWYNIWSVITQQTEEWNKHGEWRLFWRTFLGESNFNCAQGQYSCTMTPPSIETIRRKYPKNRPLGRRVMFIALTYNTMHEYTSAVNERFTLVKSRFNTLIPDMVQAFTLQVDSDKKQACDTIQKIVNEVVSTSVNIALGALTDGILSGVAQYGMNVANDLVAAGVKDLKYLKALATGKPKFPRKQWKQKSWPQRDHIAMLKDPWKFARYKEYDYRKAVTGRLHDESNHQIGQMYTGWQPSLVGAVSRFPHNVKEYYWPNNGLVDYGNDAPSWDNSVVNDAYLGWPTDKMKEYYERPVSSFSAGGTDLPTIVGGKGGGWRICSEFEGDWNDINPTNEKLLLDRMGAELEIGRKQVWRLFKEIYEGATPEVGEPSMVARWMLARQWVGAKDKGSVMYDLNHLEEFNREFEIGFAKELASSTLAAGYNYMKCAHRDDAAEKCGKVGQWYQNIFCPRPDTDPTLVCQVSRWYFSDTAPHETNFVAINSLENFGHLHDLNFKLKDLLMEAYDNYEIYGNSWTAQDWGVISFDTTNRPKGFHLPVCVHEGQSFKPFVFQRPWEHNWDFPAVCGDHSANETADFMKAITLSPGSVKFKDRDHTILDRIPRILLDNKNMSPYTAYMTMCAMGIRWPNDVEYDTFYVPTGNKAWTWWRLKTDKDAPPNCNTPGYPDCPEDQEFGDRDCGLVKAGTTHMTADEATLWFCTNGGNSTIFQRQTYKIYASLELRPTFYHQEYWCDQWLNINGIKLLEAMSNQTIIGEVPQIEGPANQTKLIDGVDLEALENQELLGGMENPEAIANQTLVGGGGL